MSKHLTFRLTNEEIDMLDAGCRTLGLTRSAFLRFALREAAKGAEVEHRLAGIEQSLSEMMDLFRKGSIPAPPANVEEGEKDDGMRAELAQSLRGIIDGDI